MAVAEVQAGAARIFAMDGARMVVLTGAATVTHESADLEAQFDTETIKGQNGEVETLIASNPNYTLTVNFAPNGATRAAAILSCANAQPAPLSKVVLSDFSVAAYNGNWNSMGYSIKMSHDGHVTMSIKLWASGNATARAALTAGFVDEPPPP